MKTEQLLHPLVSVIIPCYNQGEFLREAILSTLNAGYAPLEIIVIDDASTDPETPKVIQDAIKNGAIQCIKLDTNRGVSYARNAGIKASNGEFCICLDADDRLPVWSITKSVSVLQSHPEASFVYGNYECFWESRRLYRGAPFHPLLIALGIIKIAPASIFRKSVWETLGGYDENRRNRIEDWDFWYRIIRSGRLGVYSDFLALQYRRTQDRKYAVSRYESVLSEWYDTASYLCMRHKNATTVFLMISIGIDGILTKILRFFGKKP